MKSKRNLGGYVIIQKENRRGRFDYDYEHRLVAEKEIIHRKLRDDEIVHHVNGDKTDNSSHNLVVISKNDHARIHSYIRKGELVTRDYFDTMPDGSCKLKSTIADNHSNKCEMCGKPLDYGSNLCKDCSVKKLYIPIRAEFVDRVKKEIANSSVSSVARRAGVSDKTVANWVSGKRKYMLPNIHILPEDPSPPSPKVVTDSSRKKISQSLKEYWEDRPSPNDIPVVEIEKDGKVSAVYRSCKYAERKVGAANSRISACTNGKRKTCGGKFWCKFDAYTEFDYRKTESDFEFITDTDGDFNS